jgi:hypothetical protein
VHNVFLKKDVNLHHEAPVQSFKFIIFSLKRHLSLLFCGSNTSAILTDLASTPHTNFPPTAQLNHKHKSFIPLHPHCNQTSHITTGSRWEKETKCDWAGLGTECSYGRWCKGNLRKSCLLQLEVWGCYSGVCSLSLYNHSNITRLHHKNAINQQYHHKDF